MNAGAFEYLNKRAEALARYSQKMRESVAEIEEIFGDVNFCRVCGLASWKHCKYAYIPAAWSGRYVYTDELPEGAQLYPDRDAARNAHFATGATRHDAYFPNPDREESHAFVAKIELNCGQVLADEPVCVLESEEQTGRELRLILHENEMKLALVESDGDGKPVVVDPDYSWLRSASRKTIKLAIKQGNIQLFLAKLKNHLDEMTAEYEEVAALADKLAQATRTS